MTEIDVSDSNLVNHALYEMQRVGMHLPGSAYDGMLYDAVLELIIAFSRQGHSGLSAAITVDLFKTLASFEPLGPITDDPSEWNEVTELNGGVELLQNRRRSSAFSEDGGKTYYLVDDPSRRARLVTKVWWRVPSRIRRIGNLHQRVLHWPRYKSASAVPPSNVSDR